MYVLERFHKKKTQHNHWIQGQSKCDRLLETITFIRCCVGIRTLRYCVFHGCLLRAHQDIWNETMTTKLVLTFRLNWHFDIFTTMNHRHLYHHNVSTTQYHNEYSCTLWVSLCHRSVTCLLSSCLQEPTQALPHPKTETAQTSLPSNPEKEPNKPSNSPYSPSLALLRLLQTAFNRQLPALQQPRSEARPSSAWRKPQPGRSLSPPATRLPPQTLYQALDLINKYRGPQDSVYSDYADGFYNTKPYRHRDDRLLQALFDMIDDDRKWRPQGEERRGGEGRREERNTLKRKHGSVLVGEQRNKAERGEKAEGWDQELEEWRRREETQERGTLPLSSVFFFFLCFPKNAANLIFTAICQSPFINYSF